jgi:hypothetical protein
MSDQKRVSSLTESTVKFWWVASTLGGFLVWGLVFHAGLFGTPVLAMATGLGVRVVLLRARGKGLAREAEPPGGSKEPPAQQPEVEVDRPAAPSPRTRSNVPLFMPRAEKAFSGPTWGRQNSLVPEAAFVAATEMKWALGSGVYYIALLDAEAQGDLSPQSLRARLGNILDQMWEQERGCLSYVLPFLPGRRPSYTILVFVTEQPASWDWVRSVDAVQGWRKLFAICQVLDLTSGQLLRQKGMIGKLSRMGEKEILEALSP